MFNWKRDLKCLIQRMSHSKGILKLGIFLSIFLVTVCQLPLWSNLNATTVQNRKEDWSITARAHEKWLRLSSTNSCSCVMSHHDIKTKLKNSRRTRILHQTWKSPCMPNVKKSSIESWTRVLGLDEDFKYVFWDDNAIACWIQSLPIVYANTGKEDFYKRVSEAYKVLFEHEHQGWDGVKRADFWRWLAIYEFGGMYMDTDIRLNSISNIDAKANLYKFISAWEAVKFMNGHFYGNGRTHPTLMVIGFLISEAHHDFPGLILDKVSRCLTNKDADIPGFPWNDGSFCSREIDVLKLSGPFAAAEFYNMYTSNYSGPSQTKVFTNKYVATTDGLSFAYHENHCTWCHNKNSKFTEEELEGCTAIRQLIGSSSLIQVHQEGCLVNNREL